MKVSNTNGTAKRSCKCGTWLDHWQNFNDGQTATQCSAIGCSNTDLVGAHVQKITLSDYNEYIVPFCNAHNMQTAPKWIEINSGTDGVLANKQKTCE